MVVSVSLRPADQIKGRGYAAVVLYFRTQEDAQQFVGLFKQEVVSTAAETVMRLD